MSPLIWWLLCVHSNSSPRLVSRVHLVAFFPLDFAFSINVEFSGNLSSTAISSASISFRCIPISTLPAAMRDEIHSGTPLVDHRSRKLGMVSAETDPISFFCSLRKNATLDKFRNKRKVGCGGRMPCAGMRKPHEWEGAEWKRRENGVAEGGRGPTGKGWNRGRTVNLTIYPLHRGRGVRRSEEARKRWSASCCPNKITLGDRSTEWFLLYGDNCIIYITHIYIYIWSVIKCDRCSNYHAPLAQLRQTSRKFLREYLDYSRLLNVY